MSCGNTARPGPSSGGTEHDDPHPGPLPHRTYAELVGGPPDGLLLDIHGWRTEEVAAARPAEPLRSPPTVAPDSHPWRSAD
ncbi:hypothetical protein ACIQNG_26000 [Streptomyces sp. NPDC091377]|uniref:hypothetical protein n=1 Tax=Streptomyces sp. NPDC091377 TaxID=3365995 RepID=UPI0038054B25